jgi:hypothetical protein
MSISSLQSPKMIALLAGVLLAAGAGVWALTGSSSSHSPAKVEVPQEFTLAALEKAEPRQAFDNFRKAMDREDLTEAQKEQIRENGREAMEKRMDSVMDEYFTAPEAEKKKILDRQIDEWEKMRADREAERAKEDENKTEEEKEKDRQRWRDRMRDGQNRTQAERKSRSESRNPDKMARRMAYFSAVRARMTERGMQPPQWGPGGRGGPGGGRPRP